MVDIQTLQTISIAIASAGILVAAIYYVLQLRHQTRIRKTDLIMRLYLFYSSKEYQEALARHLATDFKDYDDFVRKYGAIPTRSLDPNQVQISFQMVSTFFEGVGVLLSEKLLDINIVQKLFAVEVYWKKTEPLIGELRRQLSPKLWEWFEYLYNEVKKREQQLAKTK